MFNLNPTIIFGIVQLYFHIQIPPTKTVVSIAEQKQIIFYNKL